MPHSTITGMIPTVVATGAVVGTMRQTGLVGGRGRPKKKKRTSRLRR